MQIVIDIPEETHDFVQNTSFVEDERTLVKQSNADRQKTLFLFDIIDAIRSGTPLPKGHGRLIDISDIEWARHLEERNYIDYDVIDWDDIANAPTIIEADKAGEEE